jgi:hypothetical protein
MTYRFAKLFSVKRLDFRTDSFRTDNVRGHPVELLSGRKHGRRAVEVQACGVGSLRARADGGDRCIGHERAVLR